MNKKLKETYKLSGKLFLNISKSCKNCNTCCGTYGWLLKQETKEFSKKGYSIVEINRNLYCLDSFARNENNKRILNRIPKCLFYKKGKCLIYKERPLDCRLYPIKVKFKQNRLIIGLSLGCKYISSLTEEEREQLCRKVINFFRKAPPIIINNYLNLMENVNLISKPKSFWMRKITEMEKKKDLWKMIK